jgi:hypothetical protein
MRELAYHQRIRAALRDLDAGFEVRRKHPRVHFIVGGRPHSYTVSASRSDWRAAAKAIADLRRLCRLNG